MAQKFRPECQKCAGKGYLKTFSHVVRGVCFRCWGSGDDFPIILAATRKRLVNLRLQWRQARKSGNQEALAKITQDGIEARTKFMMLQNELAGFRAEAQAKAG